MPTAVKDNKQWKDIAEPRQKSQYSMYLRPGARFIGKQITDSKTHDVEIEIKHADLAKATVSGYLKISKLTDNIPNLVTYFDGEIISPRYSFLTKHKEWGSSCESDLQHWQRFVAFKILESENSASLMDPDYVHKDYLDKPCIFMRWKERFLVPNHEITELYGASFSGFYYICLNQTSGNIRGFYYQSGQSHREMFQSIELEYAPSTVFPQFEFR